MSKKFVKAWNSHMNDNSDESSITRLVPNKTDYDRAMELRQALIEVIQPVLSIIDAADRDGFEVVMGFGKGPLGKQAITVLRVMKEFK